MTNHRIHTIYFDFGNVLTLPSNGYLTQFLNRTAEKYHLSYSKLREAYEKYRPFYDRDTWDTERYWKAIFIALDSTVDSNDIPLLVQEDDQCWSQMNEATLRWIQVLRDQGFDIGLLTNMPVRFYRSVVEPAPWKELFQYQVVSGALGLIKPEEDIFRYAISLTGKPADGILYLDDIAIHVETASRLGIRAHQFTDLYDTAKRICPMYSLPVPPAPRVLS
ncbi:MAG: HAD hydrolase-like protein [Spirochaetes bacterium]|nr:HAD hydrolase-like protein [Spirochaetota bacterium]